MINYFRRSLRKLIKALGICFLIFFTILVGLGIVISISANDSTGIGEALLYITSLSAGLSVFCMILALFTEYYEYQRQWKLFKKPPFSQLSEKGFKRVELFKNSVWKLYQEVEATQINGFNIVATMHTISRVSFSILTDKNGSVKFQLPDEFREAELFYDKTGLVLTIAANSFWTPSAQKIIGLLQILTLEMSKYGFQPTCDFKSYETKLKKDIMMKGLTGGLG